MTIHEKRSSGERQGGARSRLKAVAAGLAVAVVVTLPGPVGATNIATYTSPAHTFTIFDTIGGFNALIFAEDGNIICGLPQDLYPTSPPCDWSDPEAQQPVTDRRTGLTLYPVESEFGFEVTDFVGAEQKVIDYDYEEGFVADLFTDTGEQIGMLARSARTARFKTPRPLGGSCAGLGAGDVKCDTEHYTVMENVLTCFETVPYFFADPVTGEQGQLINPITGWLYGTCEDPNEFLEDDPNLNTKAAGPLDDELFVIVDGVVTDLPLKPDVLGFPNLDANEGNILNEIATSQDYAMTKKDDGKPLYRWGTIFKRPTDLRFYIGLPVAEEWKTAEEPFEVVAAEMTVSHRITNNPNDQVRPEDYENEGATGRTPDFDEIQPDDPLTDVDETIWVSSVDCFEGDGDFIPQGTYLRNGPFAHVILECTLDAAQAREGDADCTTAPALEEGQPFPYSSDLREARTAAWYTTINRDPFENAVETVAVLDENGDPVLDENDDPVTETVLVGGPRWRLKSNKFGQDIPGLEIPFIECSPTPFQKDNIKYPVGEETVTLLNLLDWADDNFIKDETGDLILDPVTNCPLNAECEVDNCGDPLNPDISTCVAVSPLSTTEGWVDPTLNPRAIPESCDADGCISVNGLKLTSDFDLAIYIKGEAGNATTLFDTAFSAAFVVPEPTDFGDVPPTACPDESPELVCASFVNTTENAGIVITEVDDVTGEPVESVQPSEYPTLLAEDGARHAILDDYDADGNLAIDMDPASPTFGQLIGDGIGDVVLGIDADPEFDGQPSLDALEDDQTGLILDDEDGIVFDEAFLPGAASRVTVSFVKQTPTADPVLLNGWVDFNRDGDWDDDYTFLFDHDKDPLTPPVVTCVDEHVFDDVDLEAADALDGDNLAGQTKLPLVVPPITTIITTENGCDPAPVPQAATLAFERTVGSVIGPSFSRFRVSTAAGLGYSQPPVADYLLLPNGEVEDHPVGIGGKFDDILGNVASVVSEDIGVDPGDLFVARSDGSSFSTSRWRAGAYAPILDEFGVVLAEWVDIHVGDYNGDGFDDVVGARNDNGQLKVALSDVNDVNGDGQGTFSFVEEVWGTRPETDDYDWIFTAPGVFTADARYDTVQRRSDNGNLWVAVSTTRISPTTLLEENTFVVSNWGGPFNLDEDGTDPWVDFMTGDFNGDGRTDVIARDDTDQTWKVARAVTRVSEDGTVQDAFQSDTGGQWPGATEWEAIRVGDFNGDGLDDLAGRDANTSLWRISLTSLSDSGNILIPSPENWCVNVSCVGAFVAFEVGDYNGDDAADIAMLSTPVGDAGNRRWQVLLSNGADAFAVNVFAGDLSQGTWVDITVGDFSGDGLDDIAARNGAGEWHVSRSELIDGDLQFDISVWDTWGVGQTAGVDGWKDVQGGDFDGIFASIPLPTPEDPLPEEPLP